MLKNTFCHMPGVGPKLERRLWEAGCCDWPALRRAELPLPPARCQTLCRQADHSAARLADGDARWFLGKLPAAEHWRVFGEFRHQAAYIDIETTGLGSPGDHITTIALYDGRTVRTYVHGRNLDQFAADVAACRLLITYNGKCFDLPFLRSQLGVPLDQAHIDLRYVLASLGYRGGLKGCERQLGIDRQDLADLDGYFAVLLWQDYIQAGNPAALDTLLAYNILDVVNLATLMPLAYNLKLAGTPFVASHQLPVPAPPELPIEPDLDTIERLRRDHAWRFYGR